MAFFIAAIRMVSSVTVGRLKPGTNMKLKTVEINGKQYAEIDTAGLPVYVHDDGKEIGFDAPLATKKLQNLMARQKIIAWLKKLQRKNWLSLPLSKTRRRRSRHWKCCQKSTRKS